MTDRDNRRLRWVRLFVILFLVALYLVFAYLDLRERRSKPSSTPSPAGSAV